MNYFKVPALVTGMNESKTFGFDIRLSKGKLYFNKYWRLRNNDITKYSASKHSICAVVDKGNTLVPTENITKSQAKWLQGVLKSTEYKLRIPKSFVGYVPAKAQ